MVGKKIWLVRVLLIKENIGFISIIELFHFSIRQKAVKSRHLYTVVFLSGYIYVQFRGYYLLISTACLDSVLFLLKQGIKFFWRLVPTKHNCGIIQIYSLRINTRE